MHLCSSRKEENHRLKALTTMHQNRRTKLNLKAACVKTILDNMPFYLELKNNPFNILPTILREELLERLTVLMQKQSDVPQVVFNFVKILIWADMQKFDFSVCCYGKS